MCVMGIWGAGLGHDSLLGEIDVCWSHSNCSKQNLAVSELERTAHESQSALMLMLSIDWWLRWLPQEASWLPVSVKLLSCLPVYILVLKEMVDLDLGWGVGNGWEKVAEEPHRLQEARSRTGQRELHAQMLLGTPKIDVRKSPRTRKRSLVFPRDD